MKDQTLREKLAAVTSYVLEQTAFVFSEPASLHDGMALGDFDLVAVDVSFGGAKEGTLSLVVPLQLCRELSSNMLGEDVGEVEPEETCFDAAKEIVNIVTGQLLTQLYGDTALFNLSPPTVRRISQEQLFKAVDQKEYACSVADDYPIITILTFGKVVYEHQSIDC